jgi:hypothetical protein
LHLKILIWSKWKNRWCNAQTRLFHKLQGSLPCGGPTTLKNLYSVWKTQNTRNMCMVIHKQSVSYSVDFYRAIHDHFVNNMVLQIPQHLAIQ